MLTSAVRAWHRKQYTIAMDLPAGSVSVDGIVLGDVPLGLHIRDGYRVDVTHLPSGKRVYAFHTLGAAMEFVHRIAHLTDWSVVAPEVPAIVHEIAATLEAGALPPRPV